MWLLVGLLLTAGPDKPDVIAWLGTFTAGPETVALRWEDGLVYHHGNIAIPVDEAWHVTVPEFHVRHRASWIDDRGVLRLEESHNDSLPSRHELRLDGDRLVKVSLTGGSDGDEIVVRVFDRQ